ncbi:hypothetical protein [Legionella sp. CNM-4043-24]|uniref:hypothetical protein n=1 Tax=Legionella sp. CNM-4043-24 TaxID=3421646 RepID=UPI00403AEE8F
MSTALTDLANEHLETVISDKTDIVDNNNFLLSIFGEVIAGRHPLLVSFKGNPADGPKSKWTAKPWINGTSIPTIREENNYFSLGMFKPNDAGQYRRTKANFCGLYALMLDDIGTKVNIERLTLPPSWFLETSSGNYQAGYILDEPLNDVKAIDQLMNAIINAGLCDPGANGETTRLARLPIAVNGKHQPPFHCQMETWSPKHRYSVQELIEGLQLEIVHTERSKQQRMDTPENYDVDTETVCIPCPEENAVITILRQRNLYKAYLGMGKHDITCPWVEEHTDAIDSGTAYFEPDDNWPVGGLKCFHGHCAGRHIRDLLCILGITVSAARMKSVIRVLAGEIHRVADVAELELARSKKYYQRGNLIVAIFNDPGTHETRIQAISKPALVRALASAAVWERFDGRAQEWVRIDPPERHAAVLFDAANYVHLPVLNGLARQPYLRSDGSLMNTAGYDLATGMFGMFDANKFSIPDKPSRMQAEEALALLLNLLSEFRFSKGSDQAAALAAILAATIRPSLALAPMFHVRAHIAGSGKSYLCELITAFATPQRGTPTTFPADDEECRKLLLAELLRAPAVIEFDNLTSDLLAHKSLCTALTSEFMSGRILGVSKTATVNTRTLFLSSGNNVGPIQDMARRCITISLDPAVETPATRTFNRPNLVRDLLQDRERYVSAALTIIRAWIIAGKPMTECKSLVSYSEWSDFCRQPLLWLGCADSTSSVFEALSEDPDRETLARLLEAWYAAFERTPTMLREAMNRLNQLRDDELREVLHDIASERGEINRRKLGWWFKRHAGRIVNGLRLVRCRGNSSAEKWRVESVSPVLAVSNCPNEKSDNSAYEYRRASSGE